MMASVELNILGRHPMLRMMYTNISYIFSLEESPNQSVADSVVRTLTDGLQRLSGSFPWLAGQVTTEIVPYESTPVFQTENRQDLSIGEFRNAKWSMRLLDPSVFAPRLHPTRQMTKPSDPAPVFMIKATFITGAVVLTFTANHAAMDMTAQTAIIKLLSKACCGAQFTYDELHAGSRAMGTTIKLFDDRGDDELKAEIDKQLSRSIETSTSAATPHPAKLSWGYFRADKMSLEALKQKALESAPTFVSTDDALTALIWQQIIRARRLDPSTKSLLARAVDVRKAMELAPTYPGMMQNMAFNNMTVQDILDQPLGSIAAALRSKLDLQELGHRMRTIMTLMDRHPSESPILQYLKPSVDVMVTSWAKMDCYSDEFNFGLGQPETVQRPRLPPIGEGWVNFMPKCQDSGIRFAVCLKEEDMIRLKADGKLGQYFTCID